jgi:hypothetical protein
MYRGILTLMAVAGAAAATAAPAATQTVEILPQLGVSTVKYDSDMFDSSTGLGLEIGGKLRVGRRFYVEPGVFFAWGGADISDQTDEGTLTLGDFRVPLVVGLKVVASRALEVRVFAGGGAAFVTSVSGDGALEDVTSDDVTSTLWNARVGIGGDFTLVSADIGYDFGLTDLTAEPDPGDSAVNRNGFFLEAGLRFGF